MPLLSAILITCNEERDLPQALASLEGLADEIVVVDSGSTDRTCELARQRGARVVFRPFSGFAEQKNFAAAQAAHDWVLSLDADEALSPELRSSLLEWKTSTPGCAGYQVARRTNYLGKWIRIRVGIPNITCGCTGATAHVSPAPCMKPCALMDP
jgi:glycosyltransferase involved in cell wall biosynthesis